MAQNRGMDFQYFLFQFALFSPLFTHFIAAVSTDRIQTDFKIALNNLIKQITFFQHKVHFWKMLKWSFDQISGISTIAKRFKRAQDPDLRGLQERLQSLNEAYKYIEMRHTLIGSHIEKCYEEVKEFTNLFVNSSTTVTDSLETIQNSLKDSEKVPMIRAHLEFLTMEYSNWVKSKIVSFRSLLYRQDTESSELLEDVLKEKRQAISNLQDRILLCDSSCSDFHTMKAELNRMKTHGSVDPHFLETLEKQKIVIEQITLQLQSDVHFLIEKETPFLEHSMDIVFSTHCPDQQIMGMMQRSVTHNSALLEQTPPSYLLLPPSMPIVAGKEDSEIEFSVSPGGKHILPLSMKVSTLPPNERQKGREIIWAIDVRDGELGLRVLFRDPNGDETVVQPMHRIGKPRGKLARWAKQIGGKWQGEFRGESIGNVGIAV